MSRVLLQWSAQWCSDSAQWGVQFISGQIRKQETPIMNHIDDNDATNIPVSAALHLWCILYTYPLSNDES